MSGLRSYFESLEGRNWRSALNGLKKIGATEEAEALKRAASCFSSGKPPRNELEVHRQLGDPKVAGAVEVAGEAFDGFSLMERLEDYYDAVMG